MCSTSLEALTSKDVEWIATKAREGYPAPVAEALIKELWSWFECGKRLGGHKLIRALICEVMHPKPKNDGPQR